MCQPCPIRAKYIPVIGDLVCGEVREYTINMTTGIAVRLLKACITALGLRSTFFADTISNTYDCACRTRRLYRRARHLRWKRGLTTFSLSSRMAICYELIFPSRLQRPSKVHQGVINLTPALLAVVIEDKQAFIILDVGFIASCYQPTFLVAMLAPAEIGSSSR
jgi:hypothetical protein